MASVAVLAWGLLLSSAPAWADKWQASTPRSARSKNGDWSASMMPGARGGGASVAVSRTSEESAGGAGWTGRLVNREAPVDLFVSDHGALVTLGDWHSEGYEHSIVIYDPRGKIVIDQRPEDFLTKEELARTEQTVSSRWWRYRSERPEFIGNEFTLTTSWGAALRFDVGTGRASRGAGPFGRFQAYCQGTRPARQAVIYLSRVGKDGDHYAGRHCEVRRGGAACQDGGARYRPADPTTKIAFRAQAFDGLLTDAVALAPYIVDDGVYEYDRSFVHLQIAFGSAVEMDKWGAPRGGDVYWLRYRPSEATPAAREWTRRLETLLR